MNRPKGTIGIGILGLGIVLLSIYLGWTNAMQPHCFAGYCSGNNVKIGDAAIPFVTAFAIANLCLWLGSVLAILGTGLAVLGDWRKGGRVKEPKAESATCGNCHAAVQDDALRCPSCGVEFGS